MAVHDDADLRPDDPSFVGAFRGEPGLEDVQVHVGGVFGLPAPEIADALRRFERTLQTIVARLDNAIPTSAEPNAGQVRAIVEACAWAHAEWVRIHPFANGNGRTARTWVNFLALRYGLPPFVSLRPRPGFGYALACGHAMHGDWQPTVTVLVRLFEDYCLRLGASV